MVLTWGLTMAAFVLIFVELKEWSNENNPHAILGTITTILCFFQPIGAYFRPHPGTPKRPIFNWVHWLVGNVAHIIGSEFGTSFIAHICIEYIVKVIFIFQSSLFSFP